MTGRHAPYAVDGVIPTVVVSPGTVEEVSAVLAACSKADAAVVPWGGGAHMGLGGVPKKVDVVLALGRMNQVIDHEPGDMTSTVQAGMTLSHFQSHLGRHGQFLSLDPPGGSRATIGGILAANASGPRRLRYGTARDLLIGLRVVHADGTVTKGGAKVVKNVTGYDMNKLYVGSLGTLGVIVEATFRLYPIPPVERTWVASFPAAAKAGEAVARDPGFAARPERRGTLERHGGRRGECAVRRDARARRRPSGRLRRLGSRGGGGPDPDGAGDDGRGRRQSWSWTVKRTRGSGPLSETSIRVMAPRCSSRPASC